MPLNSFDHSFLVTSQELEYELGMQEGENHNHRDAVINLRQIASISDTPV